MPAAVTVVAGACQGCRMNLPPQQYNQLRINLNMDVCPSCNRIIFPVEALEAPKS